MISAIIPPAGLAPSPPTRHLESFSTTPAHKTPSPSLRSQTIRSYFHPPDRCKMRAIQTWRDNHPTSSKSEMKKTIPFHSYKAVKAHYLLEAIRSSLDAMRKIRNRKNTLSTHSSPTAIRKPEERKNTRSTHFSTHSTQTEFLVNPFSSHLILGNRLKSDFDCYDALIPFIHYCIGIVNLVCLWWMML